MATYAIGDIQGCFTTLERLLSRIAFDEHKDRLWLTGDLVNRGPDSLAVLRWAKGLGSSLVTVLGNHDIHLLAVAAGVRKSKPRDTLAPVLEAPDGEELVRWLAGRPLLHREDELVLVHAGLHPDWSLDEAELLAREAEGALSSAAHREVVEALYSSDGPMGWSDALTGPERLRVVVAALTRMRVLDERGFMVLDFSRPPSEAPRGLKPWYRLYPFPPSTTVLFGHWAALGLHLEEHAIGLDTGCVWGRHLTALRLEDRRVFRERSELARETRT